MGLYQLIELVVRIANYIFAFGMPFTHIAGYLAGFVSFLFVWKFWDRLKKERIFVWISIFLVYGLLRSIFSDEPKIGFGTMFGYLSSWLWPFVLGYALNDFSSFRRVLAGYSFTISVIVFFSILAYFGFFYKQFPGDFYLVYDGLLKGLRSHIALAAICLVLSFFSLSHVVLRKELILRTKVILGMITLFFIGAIFLTGSRGYYIGGLISYAGFAVFQLIITGRWRFFLFSLIVFISTVTVLYFTSPYLKERISRTGAGDNNVRERIALYRVAVSEIRAKPFFGFGPGQGIKQKEYFNILPEEQRNVSRHPHLHSFYLNFAADFGLLGLSIFAIIMYCIFGKLYLIFKTESGLLGSAAFGLIWGLIGVLVGECFDTLLRGPGTAMELFWFLGLIIGRKKL